MKWSARKGYDKVGLWSSEKLEHNYSARAVDKIGRILAKVGADVDFVFDNPDSEPLAGEDKKRDRQEREYVDAGNDALEDHKQRQAVPPDGRDGDHAGRERERKAYVDA